MAQSYPDWEEVRTHLRACHAKGHTIAIRSGERYLRECLQSMGIPFVERAAEKPGDARTSHPEWPKIKTRWAANANLIRDCMMLRDCDHVVVFHDRGSTVTKWWIEHLDEWWKVIIWGDKLHVFQKGKEKKRYRQGRSKAE